jgi:hypothetical protein
MVRFRFDSCSNLIDPELHNFARSCPFQMYKTMIYLKFLLLFTSVLPIILTVTLPINHSILNEISLYVELVTL